ncbi:unnamed protein product [Paramecium octaurelia]|uniref:C2 domain-containing protein n=1 Tax=Paramecium octaurelia TaxID=43137 RepID=A0A8S1VPF4_PAROT|nr:unnamed protein product [Paramecium octaurelia]
MITLKHIEATFERFGFLKNQSLTGNEIQQKMDQMIGTKDMDRDVLNQILAQCHKSINQNYEQSYRMQDLAQTIHSAIIILGNKLEKIKTDIHTFREKQKKHQTQMSATSNSSEFKHIYLMINSANNISKKISYTDCHLQVALGSQSQRLKPIEHFDKVNPEFNREIEFSIPNNIYILTIQLYTKQNDSPLPTLMGQAQISLSTLEEQLKTLKLQLKDPLGKEVGCFIDMQVQLILNRYEYLQNQVGQSGDKIDQLTELNKQVAYQYDLLTRPFRHRHEEKITNENGQTSNQQESSFIQLKKPEEVAADPLQTSKVEINKTDQNSQPEDEYPQAPYDLDLGMTIFSFYGLITLFVCSAKPSFLDVLVCHGLMFTVFLDRFEPEHVKLVGLGLMASIIYDILWLSQYHSWWDSNDQNNPEWGEEASMFLKIILVLTYIQFFYKFLVFYYLYQFYKESLDPVKSYIFKIWNIEYKVGKNRQYVFWQ